MIRSMTGYGRVQQTVGRYTVLFEIKTVNHRFLEFSMRLPRQYGFLEEKLKACLQRYITRGKADVFVTVDAQGGADEKVLLNESLASSYIAALGALRDRFGLSDDITVSSVARYADIFTDTRAPENEDEVWEAVRTAAEAAAESLVAMRGAEGERLRKDLEERAVLIAGLVGKIEERSPQTVEEYRAKLGARMKEILADAKIDENRILLEAAIYADKVSVTEETVRLRSHLRQFGVLMAGGSPVGRKLDFLLQEMNREINTIGSKASDLTIAGCVVEIKAELEKIREQIQNIE